MDLKMRTVTAQQARKWLENTLGHGQQRALSRTRVERFAKIMADGHWVATHQAIAIASDGKIVDGQHRLAAVSLYGGSVEMAVALNADPETFSVIDVGKPRSTADILKIAGVMDYSIMAAAVRNVLAYDRVVGTTDRLPAAKAGITAQQILEFVETDRGQALIDMLPRARRVATGLGNSGAANAIASALLLISERGPLPLTFHEFVERITDGANLPPGSPILALRRWFVSDGGWYALVAKFKPEFAIALTIKAWNGYVTGSSRQVMTFRAAEVMPRAIARPTGDDAA